MSISHEKSKEILITKRVVGIRKDFEFDDIMIDTFIRNTDDVVSKPIGMRKIFLVHEHEIRKRRRLLLFFKL